MEVPPPPPIVTDAVPPTQENTNLRKAPAPPPPAQPSGSYMNPSENKTIQNAVSFLKDSRVQNSPLSRKVNFLKSKGLSVEEIHEAFRQAGQDMDLEKIRNIVNVVPTRNPPVPQQTQPLQPTLQQQLQPPTAPPQSVAIQPPAYAPHPHPLLLQDGPGRTTSLVRQ